MSTGSPTACWRFRPRLPRCACGCGPPGSRCVSERRSFVQRLVIFGARPDGSAKVLLDILRLGREYEVVGFLDENHSLWGSRISDLPVLGGHQAAPHRQPQQPLAVGSGLVPATAVHPAATVAGDVRL